MRLPLLVTVYTWDPLNRGFRKKDSLEHLFLRGEGEGGMFAIGMTIDDQFKHCFLFFWYSETADMVHPILHFVSDQNFQFATQLW